MTPEQKAAVELAAEAIRELIAWDGESCGLDEEAAARLLVKRYDALHELEAMLAQ